MTEEELNDTWTRLEPAIDQRRRIDRRVFTWLDAHDTSIAAEWLALFKIAPFGALGLASVSAIAIAALTPLAWFVGAIASALM